MNDISNIINRAALESRGIHGWPFGLIDRVRFYEIDALNHVNNVAYLRWFEILRVRYFIEYGLSSYSSVDAEPQLVVRHQATDYFAPMHMEQSYEVVGRIRLIKPTSFVMASAVFCEGQIMAKGETVIVSLEADGITRRAHKPDAVKKIIALDEPEIQT